MVKYFYSRNTIPETSYDLHTIYTDAKSIVFAGFGNVADVCAQFQSQCGITAEPEPRDISLETLNDMKLAPKGTEFQHQVWDAVANVPAGKAWTYAQLAEVVGRPKAVRAVGTALGRNPITYFIPCHRVVRKSGEDLGYRWSSAVKRELLTAEGVKL